MAQSISSVLQNQTSTPGMIGGLATNQGRGLLSQFGAPQTPTSFSGALSFLNPKPQSTQVSGTPSQVFSTSTPQQNFSGLLNTSSGNVSSTQTGGNTQTGSGSTQTGGSNVTQTPPMGANGLVTASNGMKYNPTPQTASTPYDPNNPNAALISQLQASGNPQAALVANYLTTSNNANQYGAQLSNQVASDQSEAGSLGGTGNAMAQVASSLGTPRLTQLQLQATTAANAAGLVSPVSQFGVLTNPLTGQPISPGTTAGGAAFTGGVQQGLNSAGQNYANQYIASKGATGVKNTLDDFINSNPNINTSTLTAGNTLTQWLNGQQLGDPNTQTFLDDVSEYVSTLAPVLGIGGTPTDAKAYTAQQFVNGQASGQSVQQVLNNIETLANNKLGAIYAAGTGTNAPAITSQNGTQGGGTPQGSTPTSFGTSW